MTNDFPEDFTKEELNTIYRTQEQLKAWNQKPKPFHTIVPEDEHLGFDGLDSKRQYHSSDHFREQCLDAGYTLTSLWMVFHHGWEMDEWAANAEKDGKEWWLTTNHGSLRSEEIPQFSWGGFVKDVWGFMVK